MEFTIPIRCKYIRKGVKEDEDFQDVTVNVNLQEDNVGWVKDKLQMTGFIIYFGEILPNDALFRNFYDGKEQLVVLDCNGAWLEEAGLDLSNAAYRILRQGFDMPHILKALGRAVWHEGMEEFTRYANLIKRSIEERGTKDYNNRSVRPTFNDFNGSMEIVGVFNEYEESELYFPPNVLVEAFMSDEDPSETRGSRRENPWAAKRAHKREVLGQKESIERASLAVVRLFGYHPVQSASAAVNALSSPDESLAEQTGFRVVPFTGFFVSPTLIMACRSSNFSKQHSTYATKFAFSRRVRAVHGFLKECKDLLPCSMVRGMTDLLVDRIRNIGVEVPEDVIPPDNLATRWNDIMLFEVPEEHKNEVYLVPDSAPIGRGDMLVTVAYHSRPSQQWEEDFLKSQQDCKFTERDVCDLFWKYDIKCCSIGEAKEDEMDGIAQHQCCVLPGSTGSPMMHHFQPADSNKNVFPFSAINCGTSYVALLRTEGPFTASHNLALTVRDLSFVLVYQEYIAPRLLKAACWPSIKKFLTPFKILTEREKLHACHIKMLKDADEFNEYGMSFYEAQNLPMALHCFREGARMFSIATIPNQSEYDTKLRDALQSNVSSVVMSLKEAGLG
eukprot:GGOE01026005.1.p1 GENE.GGOE01026005.1~~GGOE01026005.1.p1  ORF type:complete len:615 (+),score=169.35 GGOE01026005.1:45-1889(+)